MTENATITTLISEKTCITTGNDSKVRGGGKGGGRGDRGGGRSRGAHGGRVTTIVLDQFLKAIPRK